jgi:hypothetical protein
VPVAAAPPAQVTSDRPPPAGGETEAPAPAVAEPGGSSAAVAAAPEPLPDFGDLAASPALDTYASLAGRGPEFLARFAEALETEGHPQHALLAWERVLDHSSPPPDLRAVAHAAVARLRPALPAWNVDPLGSTKVFLRIEAHRSLRDALAPEVAEAALALAEASSGMLEVTPELVVGQSRPASVAVFPVAVSLHAPAPRGQMTGVLTFVAKDASPAGLRAGLLYTIYRLVGTGLEQQGDLRPLPEPGPEDDPATLLRFGPTRLAWDSFARSFSRP